MTDQQRDPEATGPEGAADPEAAADAADATDGVEPLSEDGEDFDTEAQADDGLEEPGGRQAGRPAVSGVADSASRRRLRGAPTGKAPVVAPTVADEAVKIQDRASQVFVLGVVGVFVVILGWAMLFGHSGMFSSVFATPKPSATPIESVAPSTPASVAPSASTGASASPAASAAPSASAAASASAAPSSSAAASAAPSAAPASGSPAAS